MTENKFSLSDLAADAKKGLESAALVVANAGLNVLTPERVQKLDNLHLADKLRGAVDKGAISLRANVTADKLKAAQANADAAAAAKKESDALKPEKKDKKNK